MQEVQSKKYHLTKYSFIVLGIIGIAFTIRWYFFPEQHPLNLDALYYFWYSSDIYQIKSLPNDWSPTNNGWPMFVSLFFSISDSKDILVLMDIQRYISTAISVLIGVPVYFLCKKFVSNNFAIIGVALVALDPRLMINSYLGVTDPLFLLLITTALTLFLYDLKKTTYLVFALVSLSMLIRGEGMVMFFALSIMFFVRFRNRKYYGIHNYLIILGILFLIITPLTVYRLDVNGTDPIFGRSVDHGIRTINELSATEPKNLIQNTIEISPRYLIWVLIPNFIIFVPLGIFLIFRNRNFEKNVIILTGGMLLIPPLYAYTIPALDTRYLYTLFPIFSVLAVLGVQRICEKINKSNIIVVGLIITIVISSLLFYDYKKTDYERESEVFAIIDEISQIVKITNKLSPESSYFKTSQTVNQWPARYNEIQFNVTTISTKGFDSLESFIENSREEGLTHMITDGKHERESFLMDLFSGEDDLFLEKIFDSRDNGYSYHIKVFKIDYQKFDLHK